MVFPKVLYLALCFILFSFTTSTTPLKFLFLCFLWTIQTYFVFDDSIKTLFVTVNQELNQINDWFLANKLFLIAEKTKYIFQKLKDQDNIPLRFKVSFKVSWCYL